jgi:hypothetical protein
MSVAASVIALDVDGVLNCMNRDATPEHRISEVGRWSIHWRPALLSKLRTLLAIPGVEGAWLTTWLEEPWLLDDLERAPGLEGLVPHRADHPDVSVPGGGRVIDHQFGADVVPYASSNKWWKLRAAELLIERLQPARFAWIDDELGRAREGRADQWRLGRTHQRLLMRPDPMRGLTLADLARLDAWIGEPNPGADA